MFSSLVLVVSLKPYSMKKVALPTAAASIISGLKRAKYIITTSKTAATAKNQVPCFSFRNLYVHWVFLLKEKPMKVKAQKKDSAEHEDYGFLDFNGLCGNL